MSLEIVADLPERVTAIPRLPEDVKRLIWLFDAHPTADMVRGLTFTYNIYKPHPPLSYLVVEGLRWDLFVPPNRNVGCSQRKVFWFFNSRYNPDFSELPDWVVRSFDSTDQ